QRKRLFCDMWRSRSYGRDGVTVVENGVFGEDIESEMVQVNRNLAKRGHLVRQIGNVLAGYHGAHPGELERSINPDRPDFRARVRTSQDLAVQKVREAQVCPIFRSAGDLIDSIVTDWSCADDLEGWNCAGCAHN